MFDPEQVEREHLFSTGAAGLFDEKERDIVKAEDYDQLLELYRKSLIARHEEALDNPNTSPKDALALAVNLRSLKKLR